MKIVCITPIKHVKGLYEMLDAQGDIVYEPYISKSDLHKLLKKNKAKALFCNPNKQEFKLDKDVLNGTNVGLINTASTGLNHIDVQYCKDNKIEIYSLTTDFEVLKKLPSTSELAFGLMLDLLRKISASFDDVKDGNWDYEKFEGRMVMGLTAGVVGYGRLGQYFAKYCEAFGMNVVVYDPHKDVILHTQVDSLQKLAEVSDVIALHVHVSYETKYMINKDVIKHMKKKPYIINTSRGEIVHEKDLIDGLKNGKIAGYGTDVIEDEFGSISESPIIKGVKDGLNIIATPHTGGMTWEGQLLAYGHAIKKFSSENTKHGAEPLSTFDSDNSSSQEEHSQA